MIKHVKACICTYWHYVSLKLHLFAESFPGGPDVQDLDRTVIDNLPGGPDVQDLDRAVIDELPRVPDVQDLDMTVIDKRRGWRATPAKSRRRNRRYSARIIRNQLADSLEDDYWDDNMLSPLWVGEEEEEQEEEQEEEADTN